MHVIEQDT